MAENGNHAGAEDECRGSRDVLSRAKLCEAEDASDVLTLEPKNHDALQVGAGCAIASLQMTAS